MLLSVCTNGITAAHHQQPFLSFSLRRMFFGKPEIQFSRIENPLVPEASRVTVVLQDIYFDG